MKTTRLVFATLITFALSSLSLAADEAIFIRKVQDKSKEYTVISGSVDANKLLKEGLMSQLTQKLIEHVPENKKAAEDFFVLGNMLYKSDLAKSYEYMKRADALLPNTPIIIYELAMNEHRFGNCSKALALYKKASESTALTQSSVLWAYVTHCHLMLGNYNDAMNAWEKVNFREHHIAVESAMYEIFSKNNPEADRERLIFGVQNGSLNAACELINLDKNWEIDWWNVTEKTEYLKYDEALIRDIANKYPDWKNTVKLCLEGASLSDKEFTVLLNSGEFWGAKNIMPKSSKAAHILVSQLLKRGISDDKEILNRYENQLLERLNANSNDIKTLDLLSYLYEQTDNKEKLKKIDLQGWKDLKLQKYAESYIQKLSPSASDYADNIATAAQDFPNSTRLQGANLALHEKSSGRNIYLMKYVAAQFAEVAIVTSLFRLNDYIASLESEMAKSP